MPQSGVQLQLDRSGLVTVFCGSTDIGQGSTSVLAYIVAEVLGIDPMKMRIVTADTDLTPVDLGSYSSRVTLMTGNAALQAAERAKDIVAAGAAQKLEVPKSQLVFADEHVFDASDPDRRLTFADAVIAAEAKFGTIGTDWFLPSPEDARALQGRRRRSEPGVLLHRRGRGGRRRSRDGPVHRPEDLGRPRHRTLPQLGAGDGADRGFGLHGARRGDDGRAGLPRSQPQGQTRLPSQPAVDARLQEPSQRRHAGDRDVHRRRSGPEPDRSAPRKPGRDRCCRSCPLSPTPCTTRSACGSM